MSEHDDIMARLKTGIMRAKIATMPGHEADMRPALAELGNAVEIITQTLQRQAAQLTALRAGADTEDLHAAPTSLIVKAELSEDLRRVLRDAFADGDHGSLVGCTDADRIAQLEAEAETLHAAAEGWRKRAQEAEATLDARSTGYAEAVEATRSEIRRRALEEAAGICDANYYAPKGCAAAVRALADKPAAGGAHVGDTL